MTHATLTDRLRERAALYALGGLAPAERHAFERHLAGGCRACATEVASLAATADTLALAAEPVTPRPAVRAQLLAAARSQHNTPDLYPVVLHDQGQWSEIAAGVLRKDLTGSAAGGTISYLVRMRARSRVPRHLHDAVEHCYVVEGDVCIQGRHFRAGDFTAAQPGTEHDATTTAGGCLLLIVESRPQLNA